MSNRFCSVKNGARSAVGGLLLLKKKGAEEFRSAGGVGGMVVDKHGEAPDGELEDGEVALEGASEERNTISGKIGDRLGLGVERSSGK